MVTVMPQPAYESTSDLVEDYTGVQENSGRLALYAFCDYTYVFYRPTFFDAWTKEAVKRGMDKNEKNGIPGDLDLLNPLSLSSSLLLEPSLAFLPSPPSHVGMVVVLSSTPPPSSPLPPSLDPFKALT